MWRGKGVYKLKKRIYQIIEVAKPGDLASKIFDSFIILLIVCNIVAVMLETVESFELKYGRFFGVFDGVPHGTPLFLSGGVKCGVK